MLRVFTDSLQTMDHQFPLNCEVFFLKYDFPEVCFPIHKFCSIYIQELPLHPKNLIALKQNLSFIFMDWMSYEARDTIAKMSSFQFNCSYL